MSARRPPLDDSNPDGREREHRRRRKCEQHGSAQLPEERVHRDHRDGVEDEEGRERRVPVRSDVRAEHPVEHAVTRRQVSEVREPEIVEREPLLASLREVEPVVGDEEAPAHERPDRDAGDERQRACRRKLAPRGTSPPRRQALRRR